MGDLNVVKYCLIKMEEDIVISTQIQRLDDYANNYVCFVVKDGSVTAAASTAGWWKSTTATVT